ncbi:MAG: GxxExxY protein [Candidatus Neomarinimicrobiota bacterium]|jgi:GxxExxY protein
MISGPELIYKEESYKIIGACIEVHKELGCGFLESVYHEALVIEMAKQKIPFEREKELSVQYKGEALSKSFYADFVCFDKIILEVKALSELASAHEAQVINYLKATGYKLGLLVNFGENSLNYKRLVRY